jgi:hypothetical protein
MDLHLLRRLQFLGPAVMLIMTGVGCVYDPYEYGGYNAPPAYMLDPGAGGPPPPNHPGNRYSNSYNEGYRYGDRHAHPPRGPGRRHYYDDQPGQPQRGGTEYLPDGRDPYGYNGNRPMDDGDRDDLATGEANRRAAEPPAQPKLNEDMGPGGVKPDGGAPKVDTKDVKTATRAKTPGRVKSPYPPYSELDVSGLNSGSLAKDPTTGKVFRIP